MTSPDTGRRAPPGAPAPEPWTDVILHFIAGVFVVIVALLILFGWTAVPARGADPVEPCASGPWDIGDQWGPGPDDVIECTIESSGDPVPSFELPGIDTPSRSVAPAPGITAPPTDTEADHD